MIKALLSLYSYNFPKTIVYMLQSTEYQVGPYLAWFWRTYDFNKVSKRRTLDKTRSAKLLIISMLTGIILQLILSFYLIIKSFDLGTPYFIFGIVGLLSYPLVWSHLITIPLFIGRYLIIKPKEKKLIQKSHKIFKEHSATTIAVAGSYGKTTVKELLNTVLSEGLNVSATPANKNVSVSHASFASKLAGNEDVLIIEYGEGSPGDVAKFCQITKPNIGIITGIAPAHLDKYKSTDMAAKDIFSLADYLKDSNVYVNKESKLADKFIKPSHILYSQEGVDNWKISDINIGINSLSFTMQKGERKINLTSQLIGRHLIGPLALCVVIAAKLGLSDSQIITGVARTVPYEHRMQPRILAGGWIIDDTYNGNLEGIRAGLQLLKELPATRKIYVTPGLVDQGKESEKVHKEIGELIAKANPNYIYLMENSVTDWIKQGINKVGYNGSIEIVDDPLNFYTNLDQLIAAGDVILMQNDWTDNYN